MTTILGTFITTLAPELRSTASSRPAFVRRLGERLLPPEETDAWYAAGCPQDFDPRPYVSRRVYLQWRLSLALRGLSVRREHPFARAAAVLLSAGLLSVTFGVLASATEEIRLAAPSPTASAPLHVFYGVTPVPPPMPKDPIVGKLGGSLDPAKAVGGPVAKESAR